MWDPDRLFDFRDALPAVLKELRGYAHQKTVAHRCGLSEDAWSRYENGKQMPKSETLLKIARGLDIDPVELVRLVVDKHVERLEREGRPTTASEIRDTGGARRSRAAETHRAARRYADALFTPASATRDDDPHALAIEGLSLLLRAFRAK